jgi:hypothetical protein
MEPIQVLRIFIKCEKDLAKFYGQLKNISQLQEFVKVFEVMETHSYEHSEKIVDDFQRFHIPDLNIESLIVLHNNIKKNLFDELAHETNVLFVLKKLAETEELIGKMYLSIAQHYKKNAERFEKLAKGIETIAHEEFQHRDYILNEIKKRNIRESYKSEATASEDLTADHYRELKVFSIELKNTLDNLNLRDDEKKVVEQEAQILEGTLEKFKEDALQSVKKVEGILSHQKKNDSAEQLVKRIKMVKS